MKLVKEGSATGPEMQTPEYVPSGPVQTAKHARDICGKTFKAAGEIFIRPCRRDKGHDGGHGPKSDPAPTILKLRATSKFPLPGPTKLPRSVVFVEHEDRVKGHIYDCFSGQDLGLASDEEKAANAAGIKYTRHRAGMKQEVVIW